jgi:hypothetical protein
MQPRTHVYAPGCSHTGGHGVPEVEQALRDADPMLSESQVSDWCPNQCLACTTEATAVLSFGNMSWWEFAPDLATFYEQFAREYCAYMNYPANYPFPPDRQYDYNVGGSTPNGSSCLSVTAVTPSAAPTGRRLQTGAAVPATISITVLANGGPPPMSSLVTLQRLVAEQYGQDAGVNASTVMTYGNFSQLGAIPQGIAVNREIGEPGSLLGKTRPPQTICLHEL